MFEKVNPGHPDKVADRIAGALVDLAYRIDNSPKIAVEVLIGHDICNIIVESNVTLDFDDVNSAVHRIAGENIKCVYKLVPQDVYLAGNQVGHIRCGDNGIFKGCVVRDEERELCDIADVLYRRYKSDGKYILTDNRLIICQSNAKTTDILKKYNGATVNPLGEWTGGTSVDTGATNRKLGSDMGDSVTGGGLHGKDLSKADVSVNIYAWLKAQETGSPVEMYCAIGDECVNGIPYEDIVSVAGEYIKSIGGFEKFAEWGLIRP